MDITRDTEDAEFDRDAAAGVVETNEEEEAALEGTLDTSVTTLAEDFALAFERAP